jgi:aromatic-amino-acid transaminase
MSIIEKIFTNPESKKSFEAELVEGRKLLKDRAIRFMEEAKKNDLVTYPYCGGFFISIPTKNQNIFNDLRQDHVYVIQMQGLIRVALSSLKLVDIPELVKRIKKHI